MYSPTYCTPLTLTTMAVRRVGGATDSRRISGFGLSPVFHVAAGNASVAVVDFFGAAADGFVQVGGWIGAHEFHHGFG